MSSLGPDPGCPTTAELLTAAAGDHAVHARHLAGCAACQRRLRLLETLEALSAEARPARAGASAPDCPDELEWVELLVGELTPDRLESMLDHMIGCAKCAALWAYLGEADGDLELHVGEPTAHGVAASRSTAGEAFGTAGGAAGSAGDDPTPVAWRRGLGWAAVAAVVGALVLFMINPPPPVLGGGAGRWRGPAAELAATATVDRASGATLAWDAWPGADGYRVRVWNEDGEILVSRFVDAGVSRWPLNGGPRAGRRWYWAIEAMREGRVRAASSVGEIVGPPADEGRRR